MKSRLNIRRLNKTEVNWLWENMCKHGHRYLEHFSCFVDEHPEGVEGIGSPDGILKEEIGFFDLESTDLNAEFGIMISYGIKKLNGKIYGRVITKKEILGKDLDKKLIEECVRDICRFDRIIVHWGKDRRFDLPFTRSRALFWKIDFPGYRELYVQDTFDMVKAKMNLRRSGNWGSTGRLQTACDFLDISAKHYPMVPKIWMRALQGNKEALDYIFKHNVEDVKSTEELWKRLEKFVFRSKTSV